MRFLQAAHYTPGDPLAREKSLVVLHSAEAPEKPGKAWDVARWFAGESAPQASAHFVIDSSEVVQCVDVDDVAWAAPGANRQGLHIELVGYARQEPDDWADVYSASMLDIAARLVADLCFLNKIPAKRLGPSDLLVGASGITRHMDVTAAWRKSTHMDPGSAFPIDKFVQRVGELLDERA